MALVLRQLSFRPFKCHIFGRGSVLKNRDSAVFALPVREASIGKKGMGAGGGKGGGGAKAKKILDVETVKGHR
jgi:hypothetical protein